MNSSSSNSSVCGAAVAPLSDSAFGFRGWCEAGRRSALQMHKSLTSSQYCRCETAGAFVTRILKKTNSDTKTAVYCNCSGYKKGIFFCLNVEPDLLWCDDRGFLFCFSFVNIHKCLKVNLQVSVSKTIPPPPLPLPLNPVCCGWWPKQAELGDNGCLLNYLKGRDSIYEVATLDFFPTKMKTALAVNVDAKAFSNLL